MPRLLLYSLCPVLILLLATAAWLAPAQQTPEPAEPTVAPASQEAERAMGAFKLPDDLDVRLFAAEPMVANIVAFDIDHQGRFWVCETFRQSQGVTDNRSHDQAWLNDDLAAQTVEDRDAYYRKHLGEKVSEYTAQDDRIRLVEDIDGDGRADQAVVFADHFNSLVEGTGAGVLARDGNVYYTCIPNLWLLRDTDGDGKSDEREVLQYGYGVRTAFRGHDSHGLIIGPDGKLYFSIGDRGYNVVTADGQRLADPESGAVFRCNLDGSELEVIHRGLRNPQELAFDDYGNLFSGDNNSDSGDQARFVYVVEGGDSGWRMSYQYLPDRGPFNRENLWHPYEDGVVEEAAAEKVGGPAEEGSAGAGSAGASPSQEAPAQPLLATPAYIVPPITNISDGPSGLAYYPGTGLPERYKGRFFLCDFRGTPGNSGIRTFRVQPHGAFFELTDQEQTIWSILATDVAFGVDGAVYVSDWVDGWTGTGKGRLYAFYDPQQSAAEEAAEVARLLGGELQQRSPDELITLLGHADQRVRLEAQFALARHEATELLSRAALEADQQLARLHAIWGLGQIAAQGEPSPSLWSVLVAAAGDQDAEVRAQAIKVLGERRYASALDLLIAALEDPAGRVRYFAAKGLGKLGRSEAIPPLLELLAANNNEDPIIRHGGIMGLYGAGTPEQLIASGGHESAAARLGVLAALRKHVSPAIVKFLSDEDPLLVLEAARAVHDLPLPEGMPELAALIEQEITSEPLLRRVLNANFRLGQAQHAEAVARAAANPDVSDTLRLEAIDMLANWHDPSPRDRVLGMWRPLEARDESIARQALQPVLANLFEANSSSELRTRASQVAASLRLKDAAPYLRNMLGDDELPGLARAEALHALGTLEDEQLAPFVRSALDDSDAAVRATARRVLAQLDPQAALPVLESAVYQGELVERQGALETLGHLDEPQAEQILAEALDKMLSGQIPLDAQLDVLEAARLQRSPELDAQLQKYQQSLPSDDPLAAYRVALEGGNADAGRRLFFERTELSCLRCHEIGGTGGEVGPDLSSIGVNKSREYLLESIVLPSKTIAENFETVVIIDDSGRIVSGVLKSENDEQLQLMTPEEKLITVDQSTIDERTTGQSAMPADLIKHLTLTDLRNLVEFMANQKANPAPAGHQL